MRFIEKKHIQDKWWPGSLLEVEVYESDGCRIEYHYLPRKDGRELLFTNRFPYKISRFYGVGFADGLKALCDRLKDFDREFVEDFLHAYTSEGWYGKETYNNVLGDSHDV